jgi:hypothetical protein
MKEAMQSVVRRGVITVSIAILILTGEVFGQSFTCNYYASPTGGGNGLSTSSPFKIANFWSVAGPGKTLCLLDGVYTGSESMIDPPDGLAGTSGSPITIRAINDGGVRIDGQQSTIPIALRTGNHWFVVRGVNANNAGETTVVLLDGNSSNNRIERVVAWDRSGGNGGIFGLGGSGSNNLLEDCAAFGRARYVVSITQGPNNATVRRMWARWTAPLTTEPDATFVLGYNNSNIRLENVIGTWAAEQSAPNPYGIVFVGDEGTGHEILGSIFYVRSGDNYNPGTLVEHGSSNVGITIRNSVAYTEQSKAPWSLGGSGGTQIFANNTEIGGNNSSISSNWQISNRADGNTVGDVPNIWNGAGTTGARVCKQYVNGVLTNNPLWPWPMDARIRAALIASGRNPDAICRLT